MSSQTCTAVNPRTSERIKWTDEQDKGPFTTADTDQSRFSKIHIPNQNHKNRYTFEYNQHGEWKDGIAGSTSTTLTREQMNTRPFGGALKTAMKANRRFCPYGRELRGLDDTCGTGVFSRFAGDIKPGDTGPRHWTLDSPSVSAAKLAAATTTPTTASATSSPSMTPYSSPPSPTPTAHSTPSSTAPSTRPTSPIPRSPGNSATSSSETPTPQPPPTTFPSSLTPSQAALVTPSPYTVEGWQEKTRDMLTKSSPQQQQEMAEKLKQLLLDLQSRQNTAANNPQTAVASASPFPAPTNGSSLASADTSYAAPLTTGYNAPENTAPIASPYESGYLSRPTPDPEKSWYSKLWDGTKNAFSVFTNEWSNSASPSARRLGATLASGASMM
ncbi:hypothetical protein P7C73_g2541, partial [Tremellales sp. Uapishka_1]